MWPTVGLTVSYPCSASASYAAPVWPPTMFPTTGTLPNVARARTRTGLSSTIASTSTATRAPSASDSPSETSTGLLEVETNVAIGYGLNAFSILRASSAAAARMQKPFDVGKPAHKSFYERVITLRIGYPSKLYVT